MKKNKGEKHEKYLVIALAVIAIILFLSLIGKISS